MEDLPIPSSNMYKYVALSGVAILIVTLVFAVSELFRMNDQIMDAEERVAIMEARVAAGKDTNGDAPGGRLERELDQIRLESARKRLELLKGRSLELREWATILFTVGFAVAAYGFTRWFRKIQLPLERLAQRRAEQYVDRADTERHDSPPAAKG